MNTQMAVRIHFCEIEYEVLIRPRAIKYVKIKCEKENQKREYPLQTKNNNCAHLTYTPI